MKQKLITVLMLLPLLALAQTDALVAIDCGDTYEVTAVPDEGFKFVRWTDGVTDNPRELTADQDATFTAVFAKDVFTISFVNYDGTPLQSTEVKAGTVPEYKGETPTMPADAQYTYTFSGWSPEVEAVTGEATYTAQFSSTVNKYVVSFVNYDGTPLQSGEVEYGVVPEYTGETPTKPADSEYSYTFSGWTPEIVAVIGEVTYTAQFSGTVVINENEEEDLGGIQGENPDIIVEPGGTLNVNWTDIRVGVITVVSIGSSSGQIHGTDQIGDDWRIVLEYRLNPFGSTASPNLWYAFAVPFKVDIETGITRAYGKKSHVSGEDFLILEYDGWLRATTGKGWKQKLTGTLEPGTFYMIGIEGNCNRWLFEKKSDAAIQGDNQVNLNQYFAGNSDNGKHNGWNGKGNSRLEYSEMDLTGIADFLYLYNNEFGKFELTDAAGVELCVGQPFFVQASADASFDFVHNGGSHPMPALRAPQTAKPQMHFTLTSDQMHVGTDHMYITMHEDAATTYTIGRDVARMSMNCQTAAQLWCLSADGTELAAHDIALPETETVIPLGLFAPKDGEYLLNRSGRATDDFEVELLHNGTYAATLFADQPLVLNLNAGTTTDYSLRIRRRMPTDLENTAAKLGGSQKILHDGHLYILQGAHIFDAQGKLVK